jgi:hypothetical protein
MCIPMPMGNGKKQFGTAIVSVSVTDEPISIANHARLKVVNEIEMHLVEQYAMSNDPRTRNALMLAAPAPCALAAADFH